MVRLDDAIANVVTLCNAAEAAGDAMVRCDDVRQALSGKPPLPGRTPWDRWWQTGEPQIILGDLCADMDARAALNIAYDNPGQGVAYRDRVFLIPVAADDAKALDKAAARLRRDSAR